MTKTKEALEALNLLQEYFNDPHYPFTVRLGNECLIAIKHALEMHDALVDVLVKMKDSGQFSGDQGEPGHFQIRLTATGYNQLKELIENAERMQKDAERR